MSTLDYSLYLVTDRGLAQGRPVSEVVRQAVEGGVTVVQLREKAASGRAFLEEARRLKELLAEYGIPLIINDRLDIALAVDADGVHLGQDDLPLEVGRALLGPTKIIGISVNTVAEAEAAAAGGADYLGVSPVFETPTKTDTPPAVGLEGVARLRAAVKVPLVGIGGINPANAGAVIRAGCQGVAVVSAIMAAPDPRQAARELREEVERAREAAGDR
jgi:thiamine-phosphate pyrophosphorylase